MAALESIFRRLTWETRGLKIEGEYLSHLRFADYIFIIANTPQELQQMLLELADESENHGLKMNKSKIKVVMETTHQYISTTLRSRTLKATSTWDRYIAPETKSKTRRFKEDSRPDGQHSSGTTASWRDKSTTHSYFQQWHTSRIYGHSSKEQANSRTNKNGMEYVKHHIPGQKKIIWVREKTTVTDVIEQVRRRKWTWDGGETN